MNPETYALWASIHGHLAVLGLAVLAHPLITLRRRPGLATWTLRTTWIAAAMVALPFGLGWWLYPTYRGHVKPGLRAIDHPALWRFESKEHLAAACLALVVGGAVVLTTAGRTAAGRRAAWWLLACGWLAGVTTAGLGVYVASVAQPGWDQREAQ